MKKKRVYISGPISGHDMAGRRLVFIRTKRQLEEQGYEVFNPMENGLSAEATTHQHMHRDLSVLTNEAFPFDAIFMMRKWLHSAGCKLEFDVATAIGLNVIFQELADFVMIEFK